MSAQGILLSIAGGVIGWLLIDWIIKRFGDRAYLFLILGLTAVVAVGTAFHPTVLRFSILAAALFFVFAETKRQRSLADTRSLDTSQQQHS